MRSWSLPPAILTLPANIFASKHSPGGMGYFQPAPFEHRQGYGQAVLSKGYMSTAALRFKQSGRNSNESTLPSSQAAIPTTDGFVDQVHRTAIRRLRSEDWTAALDGFFPSITIFTKHETLHSFIANSVTSIHMPSSLKAVELRFGRSPTALPTRLDYEDYATEPDERYWLQCEVNNMMGSLPHLGHSDLKPAQKLRDLDGTVSYNGGGIKSARLQKEPACKESGQDGQSDGNTKE